MATYRETAVAKDYYVLIVNHRTRFKQKSVWCSETLFDLQFISFRLNFNFTSIHFYLHILNVLKAYYVLSCTVFVLSVMGAIQITLNVDDDEVLKLQNFPAHTNAQIHYKSACSFYHCQFFAVFDGFKCGQCYIRRFCFNDNVSFPIRQLVNQLKTKHKQMQLVRKKVRNFITQSVNDKHIHQQLLLHISTNGCNNSQLVMFLLFSIKMCTHHYC